jgi:hypothetical protein
LDSCQATAIAASATSVEMGLTSHCQGNVESACKLLNDYMVNHDCNNDANAKTMVVGIVNDDFYLNDHLT